MPLGEKLDQARRRHPFLDHMIRMQQHFSAVKGVQQAGAITYFGFISVFPILALAFAVVGFIARINPFPKDRIGSAQILDRTIAELLPGIEVEGITEIAQNNAPGIASVGILVILYSGLGWLSAMRNGMLVVFDLPEEAQPSFIGGKGRDLVSLVAIGTTLAFTVALAGAVGWASETLLGYVNLHGAGQWILWLITVVVGLAANTLLFYAIFRLLARPRLPARSLLKGAIFGAVGFEALKQVAQYLVAMVQGQDAFQVFGIALILVVWINYFARVLMYAAAFAHTTPAARAQRLEQAVPPEETYDPDAPLTLEEIRATAEHPEPSPALRRLVAVGTGAALGAAGTAAVLTARAKTSSKES